MGKKLPKGGDIETRRLIRKKGEQKVIDSPKSKRTLNLWGCNRFCRIFGESDLSAEPSGGG